MGTIYRYILSIFVNPINEIQNIGLLYKEWFAVLIFQFVKYNAFYIMLIKMFKILQRWNTPPTIQRWFKKELAQLNCPDCWILLLDIKRFFFVSSIIQVNFGWRRIVSFYNVGLVIDANCCGHKYKDWLRRDVESRSKEKWWEQWAKQSECILLLLWLISCIVFCLCGRPTHTKDRISQRDFWGSEKNNKREQR